MSFYFPRQDKSDFLGSVLLGTNQVRRYWKLIFVFGVQFVQVMKTLLLLSRLSFFSKTPPGGRKESLSSLKIERIVNDEGPVLSDPDLMNLFSVTSFNLNSHPLSFCESCS